jgi:hypothetical protein
MIQQNIQPRAQQGENFHLVGQNLSFNPMPSPPPQQTTKNIVNIDIDEPKHSGANRGAKKGQERTLRYWSHEEEERLVLTVCYFCRSFFGFCICLNTHIDFFVGKCLVECF